MNEAVTHEQIKTLFAESAKEFQSGIAGLTKELRTEIAESAKGLRAEIAKSAEELRTELRAEIAESAKKLRTDITKEFRTEIAESTKGLRAEIADLRVIVERNNAKLDENNAKLEIQNKISGHLNNKLGGIIESIVIPKIVDKFNEKGFHFDSVSTQTEFLKEEEAGNLTEIDALLENGKFVIAIETKTDMKISDVNRHIKRLEELRSHPRFKGKKIYGAFTTAISREKPVNYALEKGFYVLLQPDVLGVRILDFPKGRKARAW
jgi:hypothetical protein